MLGFARSLKKVLARSLMVWFAPQKFSRFDLIWFVVFNTLIVNIFIWIVAFPYAYVTDAPVWIHMVAGSIIATPIAVLLMYLGGNGLRLNLDLRSELEQAHADLEVQANQDFLTGLCNRRAYTATLADKFSRGETGFGLMMIDLDGFKQVNDRYGHDAGDAVLKGIASRLHRWLENKDAIISRLGGDEFAVLLDGCAIEEETAEAFARKLCIYLQVPYKYEAHDLNVGASIGLAYASTNLGDVSTLTNAADAALRAAKAAGKGRVQVFVSDKSQLEARRKRAS